MISLNRAHQVCMIRWNCQYTYNLNKRLIYSIQLRDPVTDFLHKVICYLLKVDQSLVISLVFVVEIAILCVKFPSNVNLILQDPMKLGPLLCIFQ
jgi:hypothetical protein